MRVVVALLVRFYVSNLATICTLPLGSSFEGDTSGWCVCCTRRHLNATRGNAFLFFTGVTSFLVSLETLKLILNAEDGN